MDQEGKMLTLYVDGASWGNPGPAAIGVVIKDDNGRLVAEISRSIGRATNNQAEYEALLAGLEEAARLGIKSIEIRLDSELVERQVCGKYRVKNPRLKPLYEKTKELLRKFAVCNIKHIPGQDNVAHALTQQALNSPGDSTVNSSLGKPKQF